MATLSLRPPRRACEKHSLGLTRILHKSPRRSTMKSAFKQISRKRPLDDVSASSLAEVDEKGGASGMDKCLTTVDLISIGVGSCCGTGMYLTAGMISRSQAGPGGVISILVAGLGSVFTGLHYAELSGLCPDTSGSAYMYTYVTVGEMSAFVVGWGLTLEYMIGTAANAVALSTTMHSLAPVEVNAFIARYFDKMGVPSVDLLAVVICLILTWTLASGVKMSAWVNNALNLLNLTVWSVFLCASMYLGSTDNIKDSGGFFPYGYRGVVSAVPTAYYAFVGFDGLTTTGGECKDPARAIPYAIIISILVNILVYCTVVLGLTFDLPYSSLPASTALVDVFGLKGYPTLKILMAVGALAGLFASTFGSLFPLPRVLQTMAQDGLMFRYFSRLHPKRQTAVRATTVSGLLAACLAGLIDLSLLIELVLAGTLLAYVIVTFATIMSRYVILHTGNDVISPSSSASCDSRPADINKNILQLEHLKRKASDIDVRGDCVSSERSIDDPGDSENVPFTNMVRNVDISGNNTRSKHNVRSISTEGRIKFVTGDNEFEQSEDIPLNDETNVLSDKTPLISRSSLESHNHMLCAEPSNKSQHRHQKKSAVVSLYRQLTEDGRTWHRPCLFLMTYFAMFVTCSILSHYWTSLERGGVVVTVLFCLSLTSTFGLSVLIACLPQIKNRPGKEGFQAPLVPVITLLTAGINIYLMTSLKLITWLIFGVWMVTGLAIYFLYGIRHSSLGIADSMNDQHFTEEGCGCSQNNDVIPTQPDAVNLDLNTKPTASSDDD